MMGQAALFILGTNAASEPDMPEVIPIAAA